MTASGQVEKTATTNASKQESLKEIRADGFALLQAGKWASASATFEKALTVEPKDSSSLYGKAVALFNLGQVAEADSILENVFGILTVSKEDDQPLADALVLSAVISAVQNRNSLAIEKLEKAVRLAPMHFDANLSLGRAYFGIGDLERSISAFRRAVSIQPKNLRARFFLATALERDGNGAEALREYRTILQTDPDNAEGNLGLGVLLLKKQGDSSAEGLKALQKAVAIDEKLYEGQVALGKTLIRLNRAAEAIEHLRKAAEIAPNNPEPHFQLALAYRKLGDKTRAETETEIVKKIHEGRRGVSIQNPQ